jgi:hypothetical protein
MEGARPESVLTLRTYHKLSLADRGLFLSHDSADILCLLEHRPYSTFVAADSTPKKKKAGSLAAPASTQREDSARCTISFGACRYP